MKGKLKRLSASSSTREVCSFFISTYDGWLAIFISAAYFSWALLLISGFLPDGEVSPAGFISIAISVLVVFVWHRIDSNSNDYMKSLFCSIGMLAIAAIPHIKLMERLF